MPEQEFIVTFPGISVAEANQHAASLGEIIKDIDPTITVEQRRERNDTQDFGATLVIVLGTASVTAIAKGIAGWLKRTGTILQIDSNGKVLAKNIDSEDLARIAEALSHRE
jgi:hypothetical protein